MSHWNFKKYPIPEVYRAAGDTNTNQNFRQELFQITRIMVITGRFRIFAFYFYYRTDGWPGAYKPDSLSIEWAG